MSTTNKSFPYIQSYIGYCKNSIKYAPATLYIDKEYSIFKK